jgi:hypothetical protein
MDKGKDKTLQKVADAAKIIRAFCEQRYEGKFDCYKDCPIKWDCHKNGNGMGEVARNWSISGPND